MVYEHNKKIIFQNLTNVLHARLKNTFLFLIKINDAICSKYEVIFQVLQDFWKFCNLPLFVYIFQKK